MLDIIALTTGSDIFSTIVLVGHQGASSKIDCLIALLRHGAGNASEMENGPVKSLLRARALLDLRNTVVHAFWTQDKKTGDLKSVRFSARQRFERSRRVQKPEDLLKSAGEMNGISDHLEAWRDGWRKSEEEALPGK